MWGRGGSEELGRAFGEQSLALMSPSSYRAYSLPRKAGGGVVERKGPQSQEL